MQSLETIKIDGNEFLIRSKTPSLRRSVLLQLNKRAKSVVFSAALLTFAAALSAQTATPTVTFTQSGTTPSVARPLPAKLADAVNVKDFGAMCDNLTDDHLAIDAAINSGHQVIEFPEGTCRYGNGMTGMTYTGLSNTQIFSASRTTINFTNNGSTDHNGSGWIFQTSTNLTLQGLTFQYQPPPTTRTNCGVPLAITGSTNVFLSDIAILNSPCAGLALYQNTGLQANRIRVQNTWADGIQNQDNIGMVETNLYINNTGDDGLAIHCFGTTSGPTMTLLQFHNLPELWHRSQYRGGSHRHIRSRDRRQSHLH